MFRRDFLKRALATSGTALLPLPLLQGCGSDVALMDEGGMPITTTAKLGAASFNHGIASGDPLHDRVILWTRITPPSGSTEVQAVRVLIARDPEFQSLVLSEFAETGPDRDYTVKVDPSGLSPKTTYYYRFETATATSPVGRTKTLPAPNDSEVNRLRIAFTSCSNYPVGYFHAYHFMAQRNDLDAVLHLGDYIYEGGSSGATGLNRAHEPQSEILSLQDYRTRHAQYRTDADLQAMTRQHPLIAVWDDHESTNDSFKDGAENHTEGEEGVWAERKAISIQAYFEWMPIRLVDPQDPQRIWRQFQFGQLVDLLMLDTRLYGRDEQTGLSGGVFPVQHTAPDRQLLGIGQEDWLLSKLRTSTATYKVLGQQVMFGQLRVASLPDLELLSTTLIEEIGAINGDQWDGYPAARQRVFDAVESANVKNMVVLTGDIHSSWGINLYRDPGEPATLLNNLANTVVSRAGVEPPLQALGVEFVSPSVTSSGFPEGTTPLLQTAFNIINPHIRYFDGEQHGYVLLDFTPERVQGEWWYVSDILSVEKSERFGAALLSENGKNLLKPAEAPSEPRNDAPPLVA